MTTATWRTLFFLPDLRNPSWRIPVAAFVRDAQDSAVVHAQVLPDPGCLGSRELVTVMRSLLEALNDSEDPEKLVNRFGEHIRVGPQRDVPRGVDAVEWARLALPRNAGERGAKAKRPRTPMRRKLGEHFLDSVSVLPHVYKTFKGTESDWFIEGSTRGMRAISHWVPGKDRLLMLEAIAPDRLEFDSDIREVRETVGAWRDQFARNAQVPVSVTYLAYVLRGGREERRVLAAEVMRNVCDVVLDVDADRDRDELKAQVIETRRSLEPAFPF